MKKCDRYTVDIHALVADDDAMVRTLVSEILEGLDVSVDEAHDGIEAVERFTHRRPFFDLVLLDLDMPFLDGFTACEKIKALPGGDQTTIVMITGADDQESIIKSFDQGATDFITKPIKWPILSERLRFILRARETLRALSESEYRLSEAQRIARLGSWEWNLTTGTVRWSQQAFDILGKKESETSASYASFLESVHPEDRDAVSAAILDAVRSLGSFSVEHRITVRDGALREVHTQGMVFGGEKGGPELVRGVTQDISDRKQTEARIHQLAFFDEMTGLPNRELFKKHAENQLAKAKQQSTEVAVIIVDIDRFRNINDSFGHVAGDEILKIIAKRLSACVRWTDTIATAQTPGVEDRSLARLAADAFMLLIGEMHEEEHAKHFAQRILNALAQPLITAEAEIFLSGSIGIAMYPDNGGDVDTLMKNADIALENAKQSGGGCFRFYSTDMNQRLRDRLNIESLLNRAIENRELQIHYQPQTSLTTGKIIGLEALLRWHPKGRDPIGPNQFIPIAEETGLIIPIGKWLIDTVCTQLATWRSEGIELVPVAVNLSARQFEHQWLEQDTMQSLESASIEPHYLEFELTERVLMNSANDISHRLEMLKELGIRISLDDFGTGFSSMSYLKRFPLDVLKIDRSFLLDLHKGSIDEGIVRAIVTLGNTLNLTTIAEGVETDMQRAFLSKVGCDAYQGFLFCRPKPATEIAPLLYPICVAVAR